MENRIQPILCCVGAEVVGEPTQFLIERAASAAHWDWHVITVEVTPADLPKAWQGMVVMRFRAVRFFQAHQAAAMQLVAAASELDRFVGGVTSAQRTGDQWTMWHNRGPSLLELLPTRVSWKDSICWIHGNTPAHRSLLCACLTCPPKRILWTASGLSETDGSLPVHKSTLSDQAVDSTGPEQEELISTPALESIDWTKQLPRELADQLPLEILPADVELSRRESWLSQRLAHYLSGPEAAQAVVHAGDVEPRHIEILSASQPESACDLLIVSNMPGARRKLTDQWNAGDVTVLSTADLVVAEEAYDLARWTGQKVSLEVLKEAYDEYVDF